MTRLFVEQPFAFPGSANYIVKKNHKLKLWQNSKTENLLNHLKTHTATKLKTLMIRNQSVKLQYNSNFEEEKKCYANFKQKLWQHYQTHYWQNLKTQILKKKKSTTLIINFKTKKSLLVKTTWHLDNHWDVLWAALRDLAMFLSLTLFAAFGKIYRYLR